MKKNYLKKLSAAVAAAALTVSAASIAWAADEMPVIDTTQKGSINIYKYDDHWTTDRQMGTGEKNSAFQEDHSGEGIAGVEFSYIKVADINQFTMIKEDETLEVHILYDVSEDVAETLGLEAYGVEDGTKLYMDSDINSHLAEILSGSGNTKAKNALEKIAISGETMTETDADGFTCADNIELGLYLVAETGVPDQVMVTTDPFFVSVPMANSAGTDWNYDIYVYPKNQTTTVEIDKTNRQHSDTPGEYGDSTSVSIGDTVDYRVVSSIPKITSDATALTQYVYTDKLDNGMEYVQDSFSVAIYDSSAVPSKNSPESQVTAGTGRIVLEKDTDYTVTKADSSSDGTSRVIGLTETGLGKINSFVQGSNTSAFSQGNVVVEYSAVVTADAILGDSGMYNDVSLSYKRTNSAYYEVVEDKTVVYSFGISITKMFEGNEEASAQDYAAVEFILYNETDGYWVTTSETDQAGLYSVRKNSSVIDKSGASILSPAADGILEIKGLEADTYKLYEIRTLSGYSLLEDAVTIKITSKTAQFTATTLGWIKDNDGNTVSRNGTADVVTETNPVASSSASVNDKDAAMNADGTSEHGLVSFTIVNSSNFELPKTGGNGIWAVTIAGIILGILGAVLLHRKKSGKDI